MYEYLILYFNEPIGIAATERGALKAILEDIKLHKTKREDYEIVALKYYQDEELESFGVRRD